MPSPLKSNKILFYFWITQPTENWVGGSYEFLLFLFVLDAGLQRSKGNFTSTIHNSYHIGEQIHMNCTAPYAQFICFIQRVLSLEKEEDMIHVNLFIVRSTVRFSKDIFIFMRIYTYFHNLRTNRKPRQMMMRQNKLLLASNGNKSSRTGTEILECRWKEMKGTDRPCMNRAY
jgi:hypothetical protein